MLLMGLCVGFFFQGGEFHSAEDQTHAELISDGLYLHAHLRRKQRLSSLALTRTVKIAFAQQDIWLPVNPDSVH